MAQDSDAPSSPSLASLKGDLFLESGSEHSFDSRQVELLQAIKSCGSISAAAKAVGISYKTAWDRLNTMNNLSDQALVHRAAGGAQGGGTRLTEFGEEVFAGLKALQAEHSEFVSRLGEVVQDISDLSRFIRNTNLRTSARNQFRGQIVKVIPGTVNVKVVLAISDSIQITSSITHDSFDRMELEIGGEVIALIKSSWVTVQAENTAATTGSNQLQGKITQLTRGTDGAEVAIDLGNGKTLCAVIDANTAEHLDLTENEGATLQFEASSVVLMRP